MAWNFPRVFAHRGGGSLAPENTLAGLAAGVAHGHKAVEFDVMLTLDEVPVLMHDASFGRTVAGRGTVAKTTAAALTERDAGAWFDAAFDGERVPTLAQALDFCSRHQIFMNIEIKPSPGAEVRTGELVAAASAKYMQGCGAEAAGVLLSSFSAAALQAAQRVAPALPRGYLLHRLKGDWLAQVEALQCTSVHCNHELIDKSLLASLQVRDIGVFCYTVNSLKRAEELRGLGIDALCTDRIDLIDARFLDARGTPSS